MMKERRAFFEIKPMSLDLGDVLVQMFSIAIGVVLGFSVTSWTDHLRQRSLFHDTVGTIVSEITSNQSGLRVVMKEHAEVSGLLLHAMKSSKRSVSLDDVRRLLTPEHPFSKNIPLAIAWQLAQTDQGLTLLPFSDRYDLAWLYQLQIEYYAAEQRYENSLLSFHDVAGGNYYIEMTDLTNQFLSVVASERLLDAAYTKALTEARQRHFQ
jgi:hypothetical protein